MPEVPFVDFEGRTVVVTGASSGLGSAIAVELSRRGAGLILMGRNEARLEATRARLAPCNVKVLPLDLLQVESLAGVFQDVTRSVGRLYGLCHCAGVVETRPLSAFRADSLRTMMDVNVTSGFELAKAVTRRDVMDERGGALLFVSSIYASVGQAGQSVYSATKGALNAAVRALAVELARRRIRVNALSPGLVRTPLSNDALAKLTPQQVADLESAHPLGIGTPEDVARAAAFLLAPQNTWITGTELVVDGGYTAR